MAVMRTRAPFCTGAVARPRSNIRRARRLGRREQGRPTPTPISPIMPSAAGDHFVGARAQRERKQKNRDDGERNRQRRSPWPAECAFRATGCRSASPRPESWPPRRRPPGRRASRTWLPARKNANARISSAAPSQLMGSMESAERPSSTRIAPTTPGDDQPRRWRTPRRCSSAPITSRISAIFGSADGGEHPLAQCSSRKPRSRRPAECSVCLRPSKRVIVAAVELRASDPARCARSARSDACRAPPSR